MNTRGGTSSRGGARPRNEPKNVKISKTLSYLLRHGATKHGLSLDEQGWAKLENMLRLQQLEDVTVAEVQEIVSKCPKQRFAMEERNHELYIRANQGHSLETVEVDLEELSVSSLPDVVVHGTYHKHWPTIKQTGLSRMSRNHIHFAGGLPGHDGVISGMRTTCSLHIYIDAATAIADGFKFFKSSNNVILCAGNKDGYLPPQYFDRVIDAKTGKDLLQEE